MKKKLVSCACPTLFTADDGFCKEPEESLVDEKGAGYRG